MNQYLIRCSIILSLMVYVSQGLAQKHSNETSQYAWYAAAIAVGFYANKLWTTPNTTTPQLENLDVVSLKLEDPTTAQKAKRIRTFVDEVNAKKACDETFIELVNKSGNIQQRCALAKKGFVIDDKSDSVMILSQGGGPSNKPKGLLSAYALLKNAIVPPKVVCVTHSSKDSRRVFAFGVGSDSMPLKLVHQEIKNTYANYKKIYVGECIGAYKLLKLASEDSDVETMILLSPYASAGNFIDGLGNRYVAPYFGNYACKLLPAVMQWYFPNYSEESDILQANLEHIKNKKILIIHHVNDPMILTGEIPAMVEKLKHNNECYVHWCEKPAGTNHGIPLLELQECKEIINAFYKKYQLPCFDELAENGKELLQRAEL